VDHWQVTPANAETTHARFHVIRNKVVKINYIFVIPDPDFPIHY